MTLLKPEIHDFASSEFGDHWALKEVVPGAPGWAALIFACSEIGFAVDLNSLIQSDKLMIVQNFANIAVADPSVEVVVEERDIHHVIVCGHSTCRTIGHFLDPGPRELEWLSCLRERTTPALPIQNPHTARMLPQKSPQPRNSLPTTNTPSPSSTSGLTNKDRRNCAFSTC